MRTNHGSQLGDIFLPGDIRQCLETFLGCHSGGQEGSIGIEWVEAREAAKYSTMHRPAPITKNYLVRNVNNGLNGNQGKQTMMKEKDFMRFCICIKYTYIHTYICRCICI